jgi:anti-anti-sigma regulatory factor
VRREVVCDVASITTPDCETVDALCRLLLPVRRVDCELRLVHVSPRLRDLIELAGLGEVLPDS